MKIGSHVSIKDGLIGAAKGSHSYGSNTFMIYTGAPQNTGVLHTNLCVQTIFQTL